MHEHVPKAPTFPHPSTLFPPPAELNQQFGSFLGGVDKFDPASFSISPAEALLMDPQQASALLLFGISWLRHSMHGMPLWLACSSRWVQC